jgi:hypothetical protein
LTKRTAFQSIIFLDDNFDEQIKPHAFDSAAGRVVPPLRTRLKKYGFTGLARRTMAPQSAKSRLETEDTTVHQCLIPLATLSC